MIRFWSWSSTVVCWWLAFENYYSWILWNMFDFFICHFISPILFSLACAFPFLPWIAFYPLFHKQFSYETIIKSNCFIFRWWKSLQILSIFYIWRYTKHLAVLVCFQEFQGYLIKISNLLYCLFYQTWYFIRTNRKVSFGYC